MKTDGLSPFRSKVNGLWFRSLPVLEETVFADEPPIFDCFTLVVPVEGTV